MGVFRHFVCVPLSFVCSSEGRKEGVHHLLRSFDAEKFQCVDFPLSV